jgi:hypothetical protein
MGEFFRFISDFMDSVFGGWRGKVALVSFGMATSFLATWGMLQIHLPSGPQELWRTERFWFVITPFTLLAGYTLITNLRKETLPFNRKAND